MKCQYYLIIAPIALAAASACSSGAGPGTVPQGEAAAVSHSPVVRNGGSLGPVLSTSDGGQIFGFDVDQNGNDGLLASATINEISVQTFDATSSKIVKRFGVHKGRRMRSSTPAPTSRTTPFISSFSSPSRIRAHRAQAAVFKFTMRADISSNRSTASTLPTPTT